MHELTIATNLVSAACDEARRIGATRVTAVRCRIGELRRIDDELLREAFAAASEGTPCAAARLHVQKVPLRAWCPVCRDDFPVRQWDWSCPRCGREGDLLGGGSELELRSIDVEIQDEHPGCPEAVAAK